MSTHTCRELLQTACGVPGNGVAVCVGPWPTVHPPSMEAI
jgi:hypothetical protein